MWEVGAQLKQELSHLVSGLTRLPQSYTALSRSLPSHCHLGQTQGQLSIVTLILGAALLRHPKGLAKKHQTGNGARSRGSVRR